MHWRLIKGVMIAMASLLMNGCGPRPDTDVTTSPRYGFATFSGTEWTTKVPVAVVEVKSYKQTIDTCLVAPIHFDATNPHYNARPDQRILAVLPVGTRLRVDKLMKDNGNWGGLQVTVILCDGAYQERIIHLDRAMLNQNDFLLVDESLPKTWGVNPEFLEK